MKQLTTIHDVQKKLAEGAILIDVREKDEWDKSHLQEALFCPLSALEKGSRFALTKDSTYLIHCARGGRAQVAQKLLERDGFNVVAVVMTFEELQGNT